MPVSTPARVAIVIAALVAVVVGYTWWMSPERRIHRPPDGRWHITRAHVLARDAGL